MPIQPITLADAIELNVLPSAKDEDVYFQSLIWVNSLRFHLGEKALRYFPCGSRRGSLQSPIDGVVFSPGDQLCRFDWYVWGSHFSLIYASCSELSEKDISRAWNAVMPPAPLLKPLPPESVFECAEYVKEFNYRWSSQRHFREKVYLCSSVAGDALEDAGLGCVSGTGCAESIELDTDDL